MPVKFWARRQRRTERQEQTSEHESRSHGRIHVVGAARYCNVIMNDGLVGFGVEQVSTRETIHQPSLRDVASQNAKEIRGNPLATDVVVLILRVVQGRRTG